jgi:hypothetical protein
MWQEQGQRDAPNGGVSGYDSSACGLIIEYLWCVTDSFMP